MRKKILSLMLVLAVSCAFILPAAAAEYEDTGAAAPVEENVLLPEKISPFAAEDKAEEETLLRTAV